MEHTRGRQHATNQSYERGIGEAFHLHADGDSPPHQAQQQRRAAAQRGQEGQPATGQEHSVRLTDLIEGDACGRKQKGAEHHSQAG